MSLQGESKRQEVKGQKMGTPTSWLWNLAILLMLFWPAEGEHSLTFRMCGTWRHDNGNVSVLVNVMEGCDRMTVQANGSTLSIWGRFTSHCKKSLITQLPCTTIKPESTFCLHWDPLLDLLELDICGTVLPLCPMGNIREMCCTLSPSDNLGINVNFGILNGSINGDVIQERLQESYKFVGDIDDCVRNFCNNAGSSLDRFQMIEELVMRSALSGKVNHNCIQSFVLDIQEEFQGKKISFNLQKNTLSSVTAPQPPMVYLPPSLLPQGNNSAKVVCTFFSNVTDLQGVKGDLQGTLIGSQVVGITVENEVVTDLSEPVRIHFYHPNMTAIAWRRCVYWDTRKDPKVQWRGDGCSATTTSINETVCSCNHLTYFALLLEVERRDIVRHLEALTWITGLCCALSAVSCVLLIALITKQRRKKSSHQPTSDHRGLAVSVLLLCLLFAFSGIVANVAPEGTCTAYGAAVHCALLCSACWMTVEILHTFWLVYMVLRPFLRQWTQMLLGFGPPILVVSILSLTKDVYGKRELLPSANTDTPYRTCWVKLTDDGHLAMNITLCFFAFVFCSGAVMLILVLRQVRDRPEWKKNRVTFFSIWGLSLLFGFTWGLAFLNFGVLTNAMDFLFTIVNSLQGFFLLVRFVVLDWIRKQGTKSDTCSSSSGQQMLTAPERSYR
ncbi:adhesion G-protein coupled receptor G5-like isoform X2 [Scleropages formosus]|uniref:adhesion G-protein coupled receptor G5-like isoform X2 n=1 Tax=Scleropages formosus TaxID=113540 RepID=UPI000878DFA8|nr:adhesion G-protein coupled receptor G5-like isoform X2 [Scleropages formosus]